MDNVRPIQMFRYYFLTFGTAFRLRCRKVKDNAITLQGELWGRENYTMLTQAQPPMTAANAATLLPASRSMRATSPKFVPSLL